MRNQCPQTPALFIIILTWKWSQTSRMTHTIRDYFTQITPYRVYLNSYNRIFNRLTAINGSRQTRDYEIMETVKSSGWLPGRHCERWSLPSTSPMTTRVVLTVTQPYIKMTIKLRDMNLKESHTLPNEYAPLAGHILSYNGVFKPVKSRINTCNLWTLQLQHII